MELSDEGLYTCQASNNEGIDQEEIQLTVVCESTCGVVISMLVNVLEYYSSDLVYLVSIHK